jgi:hypothetical protein
METTIKATDLIIRNMFSSNSGHLPIKLVSLGADPEFETRDSYDANVVDVHSCSKYNKIATGNKIGSDAGGIAEFRPSPADSPMKAVLQLKKLFDTAKDVPLSTLGNQRGVGAHIHLGFKDSDNNKACLYRPSQQFVDVLNHFLGMVAFPLNGKARGGYKELASTSGRGYRPQSHGFEYRPCPSAIMDNPKITFIFYKIAWNITKRFLEKKSFELELNKNGANDSELEKYAKLTKTQIAYLRKYIESWKTMSYSKNRPVVNWTRKISKIGEDVDLKPEKFIYFYSEGDLFIKTVQKRIEKALNGIDTKEIIESHIGLYGLNKKRGKTVAGLSCEGYETIPHPKNNKKMAHRFGLPYSFRTGKSKDEKIIIQGMITALEKFIKNKTKKS